MLEAIYANPDSDELRSVFADQLLERGDPRGEFIALQLLPKRTRAQGKRMNELLRHHRDAWLGPLAPAVKKSGLAFERGFLARARLPKSGGANRTIDEPAWATVVDLDAEFGWGARAELFLAPVMKSLRILRGINLPTAMDLWTATTPLALEALSVDRIFVYEREPVDERTVEAALAAAPKALPRLRQLSIESYAAPDGAWLATLCKRSLVRQLERLRLKALLPMAHFAVAWLIDNEALAPADVVLTERWSYHIGGGALRVDFGGRRGETPSYADLATVLSSLRGRCLTDLVIAPPQWLGPSRDEEAALAAAAAAIEVSGATRLPAADRFR